MAETVAPIDAEGLAVTVLKAGLVGRGDTAKVGTKVPPQRPPRMCRVSLVDTTRVSLVHFAASLLVECWDSAGEQAALLLARRAYAILAGYADEGAVVAVDEVGGIVSFPDPDVGPRYQFTMQLTVHGDLL